MYRVNRIPITLVTSLGLVVIGTSGALAASPADESAQSTGAAKVAEQLDAQLAPGDRIKVFFLERLDLPAGGARSGKGVRSYYQRVDVSGEYNVQSNGSISLAQLGNFETTKKSITEVEAALASAFEAQMGRACQVSISILERRPVYVLGTVRNPGAYRYTSDMIVMQALALAGGVERPQDSSRAIEVLRENERRSTGVLRLRRLLARRARLEAERDVTSDIKVPKRLLDLAGKFAADELIQSESKLLSSDRAAFRDQQQRSSDLVESAKRDLALAKRRSDKHRQLTALREQRAEELAGLSRKGAVSSVNLTLAKTDLAESEARSGEISAIEFTAMEKLLQAERGLSELVRLRDNEIAAKLAVNSDEVAAAEYLIGSAERISDTIVRSLPGASQLVSQSMSFEIVRKENGRSVRLVAEELTPLHPGDIVRVKPWPIADDNFQKWGN